MSEIKFYIADKESDFIDFERGLYQAFICDHKDEWIAKNYILNGNRLQSKFKYESQIIYIAKRNDILVGGLSVNLNLKESQIEQIGFNISQEDIVNTCEGLSLFVIDKNRAEIGRINYGLTLFAFNDLSKKGYEYLLSTCIEKLKPFYLLQGFEDKGTVDLGYQKETLIKLNLKSFLKEREKGD